MIVLVTHLMKWAAQPGRRDKSTWRFRINEQREQVESILEDSPSLRLYLIEQIPYVYTKAAERAASETGLPWSTFHRWTSSTGR